MRGPVLKGEYPIDEPWLTKSELALKLKCSTRKVERLNPPAMRVGGQNRYRLSEVERFFSNPGSRPHNVVEFPR